MKLVITSLLAIFFSFNVFAATESLTVDLSKYSHETLALECGYPPVRVFHYSSSENLDLRGKDCLQIISYIKSIAAHTMEYTKVTPWITTKSGLRSFFLIEYLRKKPSNISPLANVQQDTIDLSNYRHETAILHCHEDITQLFNYTATEQLNLEGKTCPQAISYIKSIAAYPIEYIHMTSYLAQPNDGNTYVNILIEYLKKK